MSELHSEELLKILQQRFPHERFSMTKLNGTRYQSEAIHFSGIKLAFRLYNYKDKPIILFDFWSSSKKNDLYDLVMNFYKNQKEELIIRCFNGGNKIPLHGFTGPKSEKISILLEELNLEHSWYEGLSYIRDKRVDYIELFQVDPSFEFILAFKSDQLYRNSTRNDVRKIYSIQDIQQLKKEKEEYIKEIVEVEKDFLPFILQYDKTAYLNPDDQIYFIFGKSFALYFKKITNEKGVISYKARIGSKYIQSKSLDTLAEKTKEQVKKYLLTNRIQAVVSGRATFYIDCFLHDVLGQRKICRHFKKQFDTTITEGDFNLYLKENIHSIQKISLPNEKIKDFQTVLESENKRNKIKYGYQYGDYYVLVSGTKIHLYPKKDVQI